MQENTPLNKFDKYLKKSKTFKKYIGKNVGSFYIEIVTYQVSWSFILKTDPKIYIIDTDLFL